MLKREGHAQNPPPQTAELLLALRSSVYSTSLLVGIGYREVDTDQMRVEKGLDEHLSGPQSS